MHRHSLIAAVAIAIMALATVAFAAQGNSSPYTDAIGDIYAGSPSAVPPFSDAITTGGGTLDIVGMEVTNSATDVTFKLTVNGNTDAGTGGVNWGKFMIGIATGKSDGTLTGNGWGRPINLSLDNDPFASKIVGMDYWVGSWVDGSGGSEVYTYNSGSSAWNRLGATWDGATYPYPYTVTPGTQSTIQWSFPLSLLGLAEGDRFYFDVYSSGGGGGDSAVDALANPDVSITGWGGPYTSYAQIFGGPGLNSYKIAAVPEPSTIAMAAAAGLSGGILLRRRNRRR